MPHAVLNPGSANHKPSTSLKACTPAAINILAWSQTDSPHHSSVIRLYSKPPNEQ